MIVAARRVLSVASRPLSLSPLSSLLAAVRQRPPSGALVCAACGGGSVRQLFGQTFEVGEIEAVRRGMSGSRSAQWARRNRLIPGIIYGPDDQGRRTIPEKVYVREMDLKRELNKRGGSSLNCRHSGFLGACQCGDKPQSAVDWMRNKLMPDIKS